MKLGSLEQMLVQSGHAQRLRCGVQQQCHLKIQQAADIVSVPPLRCLEVPARIALVVAGSV